jgi:hypothetical protein
MKVEVSAGRNRQFLFKLTSSGCQHNFGGSQSTQPIVENVHSHPQLIIVCS